MEEEAVKKDDQMSEKLNSRMPMVSVVIPVYNGSNYLAQAIDSALGQDYPNVEVLVINDGSTDGGKTEAIALAYGSRLRYYSKQNGGVATALNMGIEKMRGAYFSWLSHDDLYSRQKISSQMKLLCRLEDKTTITAGGYSLFSDRNGILDIRDYAKIYTREQLETPLFPLFHCALNGCTLLIHKSHFQRAGLFDPAYITTQDYDMWFRMMRGLRIVYSRGIYVHSRVHDSQDSITMGDAHQEECNSMWIRLMDQLSDAEKTQIAGSPRNFYEEIFRFFQARTSYDKAVMHAFNQCLRLNSSLSFTEHQQQNCLNAVTSKKNLSFLSLCHAVYRKLRFAKYSMKVHNLTKSG